MNTDELSKQIKLQQNIEFTSSVKIIGYYSVLKKLPNQNYIETLEFDPHAKSFIPHNISNCLMKSNPMFSRVKINPIKIVSEGNTIGIIDQNHNAWIQSEIFPSPVNLSLLLKKRVTQIFVNEKQAILKTKKGLILMNWGSKKLLQNQSIIKINLYDSKTFYQNFFEAFSILDGTPEDIFLMSNIKKSQNSNKMYRITNSGLQIHGYPTFQKFKNFDTKIVGISVGKYHALCWDQNGGIYSWGTRCLALGFESLPNQDLVTQPTRLNFNFSVKSAFASNQYSLALSCDGKLYEWGIRKQVNEINEELIFQPRTFSFKYFNCENKKFTCLKGKNQKFGVICSSGQLYVWGQKARMFVHPSASIPKQWTNGRLYEPYLVHSPANEKIIDFTIQDTYLSIISIPKSCKYHMKEQTEYWNNVIETVRNKFNLKKYRKVNTQANSQNLKSSIRFSAIQCNYEEKQNFRRHLTMKKQFSSNTNRQGQREQNKFQSFLQTTREDKISKAEIAKRSKQKYIEMAKSQSELFCYIMKPMKNEKILGMLQGSIPKRQYKKFNAMIATGLNFYRPQSERKSLYESQQETFKNKQGLFEKNGTKFEIPDFMKNIDDEKIQNIKKKRRIQQQKLMSFTASGAFMKKHKNGKSYTDRLQEVLEKKKQLENQTFNQTMKKLEENSLEHRMKRHYELQMKKQKEQHYEILKNTLFKYLIKSYIVKMVTSPLVLGRQIKIENFARNLKFQRIQKNIRKVFIKAKVRFGIKKLQTKNFSRFALLVLEWRKYVKRFRTKKQLENRKVIVAEFIKYFSKDKIKLGLSTSNLNVRKIQKLRQWLVLVKNQRMKCLKYLWKVQLLSIMKVTPQNQNVVVCHLPKNTEEITFESLYIEKVQQNPNLKLQTFLNKSPLFKIRVEYFRKVAKLFTEQQKPLHKSQKIINYLAHTKRTKIKFLDSEDEDKGQKEQIFKINILSGDIFPYSLHYNIFTKPKNYDITISQIVKKSEKWVRQQREILQKILENIIYKHQKAYLKKSRDYDVELAKFILSKYEIFCEKRWKFIIQYNQIQKSLSKKKREKELLRIMDLIGMRRLLDQDCLPEKQAILDEALKRKDAPKPPNNYIVFGQKQFKQAFKLYYDQIYSKAKQIRKIPLN